MGWCVIFLLGLSPALVAQNPPVQPKPLGFTGDFGLVNTSGNTDVTTVNIGEEITYTRGHLTLGQQFAVVYGRSDGETTTSLWRGGLRADISAGGPLVFFTQVGWDRNRFAGIARRFEETVGILVELFEQSRTMLSVEAGFSLIQQQGTSPGVTNNFAAGRSSAVFRQTFGSKSFVVQRVEFLPNLKESTDFRFNSESALVAPLSSSIGLKVSYVIRFDHQPEVGFERTDRLLTTGVQVTF